MLSRCTRGGCPDLIHQSFGSLLGLSAIRQLWIQTDPLPLGTVGSWDDSLSDEEVLSGLRSWNEAMSKQLIQRIEHYGISCLPTDCTQDGYTGISEEEPSHR
jgi:hypothetical protein